MAATVAVGKANERGVFLAKGDGARRRRPGGLDDVLRESDGDGDFRIGFDVGVEGRGISRELEVLLMESLELRELRELEEDVGSGVAAGVEPRSRRPWQGRS